MQTLYANGWLFVTEKAEYWSEKGVETGGETPSGFAVETAVLESFGTRLRLRFNDGDHRGSGLQIFYGGGLHLSERDGFVESVFGIDVLVAEAVEFIEGGS